MLKAGEIGTAELNFEQGYNKTGGGGGWKVTRLSGKNSSELTLKQKIQELYLSLFKVLGKDRFRCALVFLDNL